MNPTVLSYLHHKCLVVTRWITLLLFVFLAPYKNIFAEGTKELFPISAASDTLLKKAILNVGGTGAGTCAAYGGTALQRIHIEIADANTEHIFMGFNVVSGGPGYYRIFDPNGIELIPATAIPAAGRGFIPSFQAAVIGPDTLTSGGYSAIEITPTAGLNGKYYIEFNSTGPATTPVAAKVGLKIFDITVADVATLQSKPGRLSCGSWNINAGNIADYTSTFDGKVYVLSTDNFVITADFKNRGFAPANFRLNFNSFGTQNSGNVLSDRLSNTGDRMIPEYAVYLNNPDSSLHPSASAGSLLTSSMHFSRCKANEFKFDMEVTKAGLIDIFYDSDTNGIFDIATADKRFSKHVTAGVNAIVWNGVDGLGNLLALNSTAHFVVKYAQGIFNFPIYDAEVDSGGVLFSNVRPLSSANAAQLQFYDDTLLLSNLLPPFNSNKLPTNGPQYTYQEFNGCNGPCHKWEAYNGNNSIGDFGNQSTVNTYFFASLQSHSFSAVISDYFLVNAGNLQTICKGDTVSLSGSISASQGAPYAGSFHWQGGGTFLPNDSELVVKYIPSVSELTGNSFRLYLSLRGECNAIQDSVKIILNEPPTVSNAGLNQVICTNAALLFANNPLVGVGTWSITSGNGNIVSGNDPNSAVLNLQSGSNLLRWKITNGVCPSSSSFVTLNYIPVGVTLSHVDTSYCATAPPINLNETLVTAFPTGGNTVYLVDGDTVTVLDATTLALGQHWLYVRYTEPSVGQCFAVDSMQFTIGGSCNKAPIAQDDFFSLAEDQILNGTSVLLNDTDANPLDTLTIQFIPIIPTAHGSVIINTNGTFTYQPNLNYFGDDFFTYQICDTANACDTASVHLMIQSVNDAPIAGADTAITSEDNSVAGFVLGNDFDIEGDSIFMDTIAVIPPQHGTVVIHPDGSFVYSPELDFNGIDQFTYAVCDSGLPPACGNGNVVIMVSPVNDPPKANFGRKTTYEDIPNALNVLSNDVDVDGNLNPASLTISANGNPAHGTAVVDLNSNKIIYTPHLNYFGNDTIVYEVCDFGFPIYCDTSITYITVFPVNDLPLSNSDSVSLSEDVVLNATSVLLNDFDPDGDSLTLSTNAVNPTLNGSLLLAPNGTFSYTPNTNFNGEDYFIYEACDNGTPQLCAQDTVFITVQKVNDAPVAANNTVVTSLNSSITANVLGNDLDVDGNIAPAATTILTPALHGVALVNSDGTILYTPQNGYFGTDSLLYSVCDSGFPVLCASAKLIIEVGYVNLPPLCGDDFVTINEDTPTGITILSNDTDPNNNIDQTSIQLIQNATHGVCTIDYTGGLLNYTPSTNYFGNDTLRYVVCDVGTISNCDTAMVIVTVLSVNDAPTAKNDTLTTDEDFAVFGNFLTNDFDVDAGDALTVSAQVTLLPQHGSLNITTTGDYNYTPHPNFNGTDSFTYEVCDNGFPILCSTASVTLFVTPQNDAPEALNDVLIIPIDYTATVFVLNNDYDVDGNLNVTSLSIASQPHNGMAVLDTNSHAITYTPNPNYFGLDTVKYSICDAGIPPLCVQGLLVFNVGATNNPPSAMPDFASTSQNTAIVISVLTNDFDVDGNVNKGSVDVLVNPNNGSILINVFDGQISYTPNPGFTGKDTIIYEICDGGLPVFCDTALVVVTVNGNLAPIANPDTYNTTEDNPVSGTSVLQNDTDPENGNLFLNTVPIINPTNGLITLNANGTYSYFPNFNFYGTDSFVYEICDNGVPSLCDTAFVSIVVAAINDAPQAVNDSIQVAQGLAFSGNLISNDVDVDSPGLLANSTPLNGPSNGSLFLANSGVFTYTPNPGFSGQDSFQYVVCDNGTPNLCDTAFVFIQVGTNNPPLAVDDIFTMNEDGSLTAASLISNDSDPDGSALLMNTIAIAQPQHGSVVLYANGTFDYFPAPNYTGSETFVYQICDGGAPNFCDTASVTIFITAVNDAPVAANDVFSILSNTTLNASVILNDNDVDSPSLSIITSPILPPQSGIVTLNTSGTFVYTPNANFTGFDSFSYVVCDGSTPNLCDTATVNITIQNRLPLAVSDTFEISSSSLLTANCLLNDIDPENGVLTLSTIPVLNVLHGTLTLNPAGTFTYQPVNKYTGTDFFFYTTCDNAASPLCSNAKVVIKVLNSSPKAKNDTVYGVSGYVLAGNLLLNDVDVESLNLVFSVLNSAQHGTLQFSPNGDFSYDAVPGFSGVDYFSYEICDDGTPVKCDTAIVTLYVAEQAIELTIPDAFSPNGDNINDVFEIVGINNYPENEFLVFDQMGVLVYGTKDYKNTWTGLDKNGKKLPSGSYFYIFDKKDGSDARTGYIVLSK